MNKHRAIEQCRAEVLPRLENLAERLSSQLPNVRTEVFQGPVGALTTYKGHHFGVECFVKAAPNEPDCVALSVDLGTNQEGVFVISADVVWNEGGDLEAQLFPDQTPASEDALARIVEGLPRLSDALLEAARRGKPGSDA